MRRSRLRKRSFESIFGGTMPKHDVLISYSTQDQALAERVVRTLTARGIRCWAAFQDLETGQFWPGAITEAINDCSIFVLLLTKHSNASRQVTRELTQADTLNKLLYCIQTEDLSISPNVQYFFSAVQRYEAFQVDLDTSLARMADDILRQLQRLDPVERPAAPTDPISSSKRRSSTVARTIRMSAAVVGSLVLGIMVTLVVNQSRSDRPDHPLPSSTGTGKAADPPRPTDISGSKIPDPGVSGKAAGGSKAPDSTVTSSAPDSTSTNWRRGAGCQSLAYPASTRANCSSVTGRPVATSTSGMPGTNTTGVIGTEMSSKCVDPSGAACTRG